jgi:hypothetical protein
MPEGPPPDEEQAEQVNSDDDIPMPEGPPPDDLCTLSSLHLFALD